MKNVFGRIYKITNKINGKIYIGKTTKTLNQRWNGHLIMANKQSKLDNPTCLLSKAINKYGPDNFIIEEIDIANSKEQLNELEIKWISSYNSKDKNFGYNMTKGGDGGPGGLMFKGHTHSYETKLNMSINRTGDKNSNYDNRWHHTSDMNYHDLHGENNPMYGKHHSEETKQFYKDRFSNTVSLFK